MHSEERHSARVQGTVPGECVVLPNAARRERGLRGERSTVIRSVFPSAGSPSFRKPCQGSSLVQPFSAMLEEMAAEKYRTYQNLIQASSR